MVTSRVMPCVRGRDGVARTWARTHPSLVEGTGRPPGARSTGTRLNRQPAWVDQEVSAARRCRLRSAGLSSSSTPIWTRRDRGSGGIGGGDEVVAPAEAPAAVAAARAGNGLVIEQNRPQRVDRPRGAPKPFQLGEPVPHGVDEVALDVGAPVQPFHGPGRQGGLGSRRAGRHSGLTPVSRRPGHRASEASASSRSRSCSSVSVGASSASVITCRSA